MSRAPARSPAPAPADANLNGNGTGTVQLDAALTLDYVKLNGITLENGLLTIKDTVEVAGAVTLLNDTVTNTGATLQVDDGQTLKLNGTTINGGTINDFSSTAGGKIDVTGASTIAGSSTTDANLNGNGTGTVQLDAALTLDYVKLNGITLENGLLTIKDTVEVAGAVTLLNDTGDQHRRHAAGRRRPDAEADRAPRSSAASSMTSAARSVARSMSPATARSIAEPR